MRVPKIEIEADTTQTQKGRLLHLRSRELVLVFAFVCFLNRPLIISLSAVVSCCDCGQPILIITTENDEVLRPNVEWPAPVLQLHGAPPGGRDETRHHAPLAVELGLGLEAAQLHFGASRRLKFL